MVDDRARAVGRSRYSLVQGARLGKTLWPGARRSGAVVGGAGADRAATGPAPGAQLSFTDRHGYRFQAIHRPVPRTSSRCAATANEPTSRTASATSWTPTWRSSRSGSSPAHGAARDRDARARADRLNPSTASRWRARPRRAKRTLYRILHIAGRLAFSERRSKLHLQRAWPWVIDLLAAFQKLKSLPATA